MAPGRVAPGCRCGHALAWVPERATVCMRLLAHACMGMHATGKRTAVARVMVLPPLNATEPSSM